MSKEAPKPKEIRLQVILTPEQLQRLDDLRKRQPDLPSRSDLIRRMIDKEHAAK
jgi:metal-responsive CopG/Arc/MetJ family transcriptional regulator